MLERFDIQRPEGPRPSDPQAWLVRLAVLVVASVLTLAGGARPAVAADRLEVAGFSFAPPHSWVRQRAASAMRKAQFLLANPGSGGDGIVIFFQFPPGVGGSAEGNIARWTSQFKESSETLDAKVETRESGARRLHYFRATGTLSARDGARPGYSLHAALLDGPAGRAFVRFVAPRALADANQAEFRKLIDDAFGG